MNSLSWFLYFAGIVGSLSNLFVGLGFVIIAAALFTGMYFTVENDDFSKWKWMALAFIPWSIASVIPSKDTMYAIAASEMGEEVYKSDIGQKTKQAIEAWIDSQIPKPQPK